MVGQHANHGGNVQVITAPDGWPLWISADTVRRLKPAKESYLSVAEAFEVDLSEVRLVAAHSWDVSGALSAGCKAEFVARPGMVLSPIGAQPDIIGPGLDSVVDQIITTDAR